MLTVTKGGSNDICDSVSS